jgi:hypothetical protein
MLGFTIKGLTRRRHKKNKEKRRKRKKKQQNKIRAKTKSSFLKDPRHVVTNREGE